MRQLAGSRSAGDQARHEDEERAEAGSRHNATVAVHEAKGDDLRYRSLGNEDKWHHGDAPIRSLLSAHAGKHDRMTIYGMDKKRRVHAHVVGKRGWKNLGTPEEIIAAAQGGQEEEGRQSRDPHGEEE